MNVGRGHGRGSRESDRQRTERNMPPRSSEEQQQQPERIDVAAPTAAEPSPESKSSETGQTERQTVEKQRSAGKSPTEPPPLQPPVPVVVESEGGTDEELLKRPEKPVWPSETDFYSRPTPLSRLILNQKYGSAIRRVHSHPEEASVWVCAKRPAGRASSLTTTATQSSLVYLIRQLPIHVACGNLSRSTQNNAQNRLLNELAATLILANQEGAHEPDHKGRLPLHDAVWYGADPDTIALFLMAKPESLDDRDHKGRSLQDLNQHRPGLHRHKEAVKKLLDRSVEFWRTARNEAKLRLQTNQPSSSLFLASSMTNLASTDADEETILTSLSEQPSVEPDEIPPISWEQLERRAIATEQILTEINEQNYELSQKVEALTLVDRIQGKELVAELTRLNEENLLLNDKLHGIENLLVGALMTGDEEKDEQYRLALAEISSLVGISDSLGSEKTPVLSETKEAKALQRSLSQRTSQQREKIRKMRIMVDDLLIGDQKSVGSHSSHGAGTTVSPLTSGSSKSYFSLGSARPQQLAVVDHIPEPPPAPLMPSGADDLDVLLSYAAAHDHAHRARRRHHRSQAAAAAARRPSSSPTPDTDDLSALLRWAAAHERRGTNHKRDQPASVSSSWSPVTPNIATLGKKGSAPKSTSPVQASGGGVGGGDQQQQQQQEDVVLPAILPPGKKSRTSSATGEQLEEIGTDLWEGLVITNPETEGSI